MAVLEPLIIKEAIGKVIKLIDVPTAGATALIPVPPNTQPDDSIEVLIDDQMVAQASSSNPPGDFYVCRVPKTVLLKSTGRQKEFRYIIWNSAGNPVHSDPMLYDILHPPSSILHPPSSILLIELLRCSKQKMQRLPE
ncbi:hypothetical protein [Pseudomonas sp. A-RE-19]|uniref:hypothetical protein n=1 Tax=Pseudomonas sp. A-RE-19 TaxID=2832401 RepID=UPI001CBD7ACC|nr:hypothetical protein [Pseudomonas sp. A-RE-19]